jgi:hypothetical protein
MKVLLAWSWEKIGEEAERLIKKEIRITNIICSVLFDRFSIASVEGCEWTVEQWWCDRDR